MIRGGTIVLIAALFFTNAIGQTAAVIDSVHPSYKTVIAGAEYKKGSLYRWLWGDDYRKEWTTPVAVPVLDLDSAFGGLTPLRQDGGRQTKTLHLKDASGKRWVLRSVNKTYLGALPEVVQGTFVENLANDQMATNHPYAAVTVPLMADAAGVYHTHPRYFFVPYSKQLGDHKQAFANTLCLLEEHPDKTQRNQADFGYPEDIVGSDEMREALLAKNNHLIDQNAYLKTRLFDMFVGDWSRHKENWRWAEIDSIGSKIYRPIPRDRDQTYAKFEGNFLSLIVSAGKFKELQTFEGDIKNVKWYNYPAFALDKRLTNNLSRQVWIETAKALQESLTDSIIENAVKQMPPPVFSLSGEEIIRKLKSRREHLVDYAREYYAFLSRDVEIPGTRQNEWFEIKRINDRETSVTVYPLTNGKTGRGTPIFSRVFLNEETKEIRVYGVGGHDVFHVSGTADKGVKIRVIGGPGKDSFTDVSHVKGWSHKTKFYDNPGNTVSNAGETRTYLSGSSAINRYAYEIFKYDSRGLKPILYYNTFYRFYLGLGWSFTKNKTREGAFSAKHSVGLNYSLIEKSFHPYYKGTVTELIGRWNLNLNAGYDQVRRFNYFGLGNETVLQTGDASFYWLRLKTIYGSFGVDRTIAGRHNLRFDFLYNATRLIDEEGRFTSIKHGRIDPSGFQWKHFGGVQLIYSYVNTNDRILPTKGVNFQLAGAYTQNLKERHRQLARTTAAINVYAPLFQPFSVAIKTGAATLWGSPEIYQYNTLGGFYSLRGFWRYRFYGRSVFYNQNELRWLPSVKGHWFSGRLGLVGFFDQGRAWQQGEDSNKWHYGCGGGVILVPFNRIALAVTYGISREGRRINIRVGKFF